MKKTVTILGREYDIENVVRLDLSESGLTKIPKEVNMLVNLKELRLYTNKIKKIENIDRLVNLERLYLHNNEIERIDGLYNNKKLKSVWLYNNKIEKIENIHHLENLKELYLFKIFKSEDVEEVKRISLVNSRINKLDMI